MGLSWQQGPLSGASVGRFLTPDPLPERLLFVEPLRRRLRVKLAEEWIADSEDVLLLHEPGRYPVAFFPVVDVRRGVLVSENRTTEHRDFGDTEWFTVTVGERRAVQGAWQYTAVPHYAGELRDRVAFAWRAIGAFYEEDDRIVGHASDAYHRIDIRQSSRHLVVKDGVKLIADTTRPVVLYESGFAPRWYVPRQDIDESTLMPVQGQTFCPYKGLASYYDIGDHKRAAWSYVRAWPEVARVSNLVSFEPDEIEVFLDNKKLALEPGQAVVPHGIDRGLDPRRDSRAGQTARRPLTLHCFQPDSRIARWAPVPLRLIVGYGFMEHGFAKLSRGPEAFADILHAIGVPAPHVMAWVTILTEIIGGLAVILGAFVPLVALPMAALLMVAIFTVHLPYGFSSIKLLSVTAAGAQFGPPGYELNLVYLACLAALVLGGCEPLTIDGLVRKRRGKNGS